MTITTVTIGVTEVYNCYRVNMPASSKVICSLAGEIMQLAKEAIANEALRPLVHRLMKSAAGEDVAFQIHNGERVLMYTGADHDLVTFLIALPGDCIDLWSYGK